MAAGAAAQLLLDITRARNATFLTQTKRSCRRHTMLPALSPAAGQDADSGSHPAQLLVHSSPHPFIILCFSLFPCPCRPPPAPAVGRSHQMCEWKSRRVVIKEADSNLTSLYFERYCFKGPTYSSKPGRRVAEKSKETKSRCSESSTRVTQTCNRIWLTQSAHRPKQVIAVDCFPLLPLALVARPAEDAAVSRHTFAPKRSAIVTVRPCVGCQQVVNAHSLVMKLINSDTHSCTVSFASFAIFAFPGRAFFIILLMFAIGRNLSCSRTFIPLSPPARTFKTQKMLRATVDVRGTYGTAPAPSSPS